MFAERIFYNTYGYRAICIYYVIGQSDGAVVNNGRRLFCFFEMSLHTESGLSGTGQARAVLRPAVSHFRRELAAVSAQHFESTREKGRAAAQLRARNLTARTCN